MKFNYLRSFFMVIGISTSIALLITLLYVPQEYMHWIIKSIILFIMYGLGMGCLIPYLNINYENKPFLVIIGSSAIGLITVLCTIYLFYAKAKLSNIIIFVFGWFIIFFTIYIIEYLNAKKQVAKINKLLE